VCREAAPRHPPHRGGGESQPNQPAPGAVGAGGGRFRGDRVSHVIRSNTEEESCCAQRRCRGANCNAGARACNILMTGPPLGRRARAPATSHVPSWRHGGPFRRGAAGAPPLGGAAVPIPSLCSTAPLAPQGGPRPGPSRSDGPGSGHPPTFGRGAGHGGRRWILAQLI
jgi:hypothetical protein